MTSGALLHNWLKFDAKRIILKVSAVIGVSIGLYLLSTANFLLFHTTVEGICIIIGVASTIMAINTYEFSGNKSLLLLGTAYFFVVLFDFFHTATYKGIGIFLYDDANIPTQLWIIARYIESISLVFIFKFQEKRVRITTIIALYTLISSILLLTVFKWGIFPDCFVEGVGLTTFKKISEYGICSILLMSIFLIFKKRSQMEAKVCICLLLSCIFTILSELPLIFYTDVYEDWITISHILKLFSFYFIYKAILETNLKKPYILLQQSNTLLERKIAEIELINGEMKNENGQRKKIEKALLAEREILRAILDAIEEGILVTDVKGQVIHSNNRFGKIWNISQSFLEKKEERNLLDYVKDSVVDGEGFIQQVQDIISVSKAHIDLVEFKNGRILQRIYQPLMIQQEEHGHVWSFGDITERIQMIKNLAESENRYRRLVENIPVGVSMTAKGKYVYANRALAKILHIESPDQLIGKDEGEFSWVHPDYTEMVLKRIHEVGKNKKIAPFLEQKIIRKDETVFDAEIAAFPFSEGKDDSIVAIVMDITERKHREALMLEVRKKQNQLEEEQRYNRMITQFFSSISHELKTPLNVILGTIQLIESHIQNPPSRETEETFSKYLYTMKQNCYRLLRLINNVIDMTKLEAGFLQMDCKNYDIIGVVEDITQSIVSYAQSKGICLIFDTDSEEKWIACDGDKIERVMLNLLSNAIKFTEPGGTIQVKIVDLGEKVLITVKDTGIGIPEQMLEKIFERFKQVNDTLSKRAEGSGIGLSLVKYIVELHGGKIMAKSQYGEGSEFIIELPVAVLPEENEQQDQVAATGQSNIERIYIEFSDIYR